jgi:hypothetical protein
MQRTHRALAFTLYLTAFAPLSAQERESRLMSLIDRTGRALVSVFEQPLHPAVSSIAPGSGVGAGIAFEPPTRGPLGFGAAAIATVRGYWTAGVATRVASQRTHIEAYARARDLSKLEFFGAGIASDDRDRSNFRLRERVLGLGAKQRLAPWLTVDTHIETLWPDVSSGASSVLPSTDELFDDTAAPGLTRQPRFGRYDARVHVELPAAPGAGFNQGGQYRAGYALFDDQELGRYSFQRLELEGRQRFAVRSALRHLTLHGWLSTTTVSRGQQVPFYLQRTLGGHGLLAAASDDAIGSDGTKATLRGFPNYRFRDRHLLLLQAEYRMALWGPVDASLFVDAGKVASRRRDIDLSNLKRDIGVGVSVMRGPTTALRADLAFGGEGARVLFTLGQVLLP